ncbi:macro domain-containing protein [Roseibium alexandrii]|nr:macro domain-containing protein [Roseibium alexandrii]
MSNIGIWQSLFAPVGVGWTLTQIAIQMGYESILAPYLFLLWYLMPLGLIVGGYIYWPKRSSSKTLPNLDTEIEIRVGDIFSSKAPIVVTIPTTLETEFHSNAISEDSIQGQYTKKYCKDPSVLKLCLQKLVQDNNDFSTVKNFYSNGGDVRKYKPGEVLVIREFDRIAYCTTFASFNEHGTAQISQQEFYDLLPKMWMGIREKGEFGSVDVPLIGSRFARTGISRNKDILRELVYSLSVASADARLADKVTFFIRPSDFTRWGFSFEFIERLLLNVCDEHQQRMMENGSIGQPLDV